MNVFINGLTGELESCIMQYNERVHLMGVLLRKKTGGS